MCITLAICKMELIFSAVFLLAALQHTVENAEGCPTWIGSYRDCTCGIKYRDTEKRCCDSQTCYQPVLKAQNLSCAFECMNGGKYDISEGLCRCEDGFHGLCCERETQGCGGTFLKPEGNFTSPGFPNNYGSDEKCVWKISTDPQRRIALGVMDNDFEVEQGSTIHSCNHDWISIYDGEDKNGRRIGSYCGNGMRSFQTVRSSGRHLYVVFESDRQENRRGFHLQYISYFAVEPCGKKIFTRSTGIITSPQYPLNYRPHESCRYEIRVKSNHYVELTTLEMDMPATADCTRGDKLLVIKRNRKTIRSLTVLCGQRLFAPYTIRGAEYVRLEFTSDYIREGKFKLRYEQIPLY